jgi:hypothetical protein
MCTISSWSFDGFGHQLMSIVKCKEYALQNNLLFVGTKKTHMEHHDPDKSILLGLLSTISGKEHYHVHPQRYHNHICGMNCTVSSTPLSICDSCTSHPDADIRKNIARTLCTNVPKTRRVTCHKRYACFHVRQTQSWENARWLQDRRPKLDILFRNNHTHKAVITHGEFEKDHTFIDFQNHNIFKADFSIFETIFFVNRCCQTYTTLSKSSFGDTLDIVHKYC